MEKKKPKWGKPKLIVLTRGKPEERVLLACKVEGSGSGPDQNYYVCQTGPTDMMCGPCSYGGAS
jgi:hypothetical protein